MKAQAHAGGKKKSRLQKASAWRQNVAEENNRGRTRGEEPALSLWPNTICGQSKAMSSLGAMDELARCDHEQWEIESREHRAGWLAAMGWADWEIERELIVRDAAANSRAGHR